MFTLPYHNPPQNALVRGYVFDAVERGGGAGQMNNAEAEDLYEMANLHPRHTGLPMVIWVSERGNAQHDIRIKVSMDHAPRINIHNTAAVGVRPPGVIAGFLRSADQQLVFRWIKLNEATLVDYWNGTIDTVELVQQLKALPIP